MIQRLGRLAAPLLLCILGWGCASYPVLSEHQSDGPKTEGQWISVEPVKKYSRFMLRFMFWLEGMQKALPTSYGIHIYKVVYWTRDTDGELAQASGLLALPSTDVPYRGVVSWQHGTESLRENAPSSGNLVHGVLPAAVFAGHGHVLLAPDYLGYGDSQVRHSYYHRKSTADSVNHFVMAARGLLRDQQFPWPSTVFLTGFSQGGYASLAAARDLEVRGEPSYTAIAPVAAAVDLAATGLPAALEGNAIHGALYVAWIAETFSRAYGMDLSRVLKEPWLSRTGYLFDGMHSAEEVVAGLPQDPLEMMTPEVISALKNGTDHPFVDLLRENELLDWRPQVPTCVFFGEDDVDVTPQQAHILRRLSPQTVSAVSVGAVDHNESILAAIPLVRAWFDGVAISGCAPWAEVDFSQSN